MKKNLKFFKFWKILQNFNKRGFGINGGLENLAGVALILSRNKMKQWSQNETKGTMNQQ